MFWGKVDSNGKPVVEVGLRPHILHTVTPVSSPPEFMTTNWGKQLQTDNAIQMSRAGQYNALMVSERDCELLQDSVTQRQERRLWWFSLVQEQLVGRLVGHEVLS